MPRTIANFWRKRGRVQHCDCALLDGADRPGLTLSGGLDSRAILAEASRTKPLRALHMAFLTRTMSELPDAPRARAA